MPTKKHPSDPTLHLYATHSDLARFLAVSRRTVIEWTKEEGFPPRTDWGRYDGCDVLAWVVLRKRRTCPTCHRPT